MDEDGKFNDAGSSRHANVESAISKAVTFHARHASSVQESALRDLSATQAALSSRLDGLLKELVLASAAVEGLSLDPETSRHLQRARDSLQRSRTRLLKIRGRLGRLRGLEECHRLRLVSPHETEMRVVVGRSNEEYPDHGRQEDHRQSNCIEHGDQERFFENHNQAEKFDDPPKDLVDTRYLERPA